MKLHLLLQWINNNEIVHFSDQKISLRDLEQEYSDAHQLNRRLIADIRIAKLSSSSPSLSTINALDENTNLLNFIDFCQQTIKKHEGATLFLVALSYLLSLPKEARLANSAEKILHLFKALLQENQAVTVQFYLLNQGLFAAYPEINSIAEKLVKKKRALSILNAHLEYFTDALKDQENPLGIIALFKEEIADTEKYAALILWLLQRKVPNKTIIATHLLHHFMSYNLYALSSPDSAIDHLYSLLDEFPEAKTLIEKAKRVSCGERGFLNYALNGSLQLDEPLQYVEVEPALYEFSPTAYNFNALLQLFGQSFLIAAISWAVRTANADWLVLLKKHLNQPQVTTEQLPMLINFISKAKNSQLTKALAMLIEDSTAEQLLSLHQGAIFHLLAYKPFLLKTINSMNMSTYVEQIISASSSDFDTTMQLLELLKLLVKNKHESADLVFEQFVDYLLSQQSSLIEDDEVAYLLKRHPAWVSRLSHLSKVLHLQLQDSIEANTQGPLNTTGYNCIEDSWLEVNRKLNLLHGLAPHTEVIDKYVLYTQIARASYRNLGQCFDLAAFIEALSLPEARLGETSIQERVLIEILAAIDDEVIKTQVTMRLESEPIACTNWMTKDYGGLSLFVKAAGQGNNTLLKLLATHQEPDKDSLNDAIRMATESEHWLTVFYLCQLFPKKVRSTTVAETLILAAQHGEVEIVKQLCNVKIYSRVTDKTFARVLETAVENNHLPIVELLCTLSSPVPNKSLIEKLFHLALQRKHLTLVAYFSELLENAPHQLQIDKAFSHAVLNNNEDIVLCLGHLKTLKPGQAVIERSFKKAAMMGLLNMVICLGNLPGYSLNTPKIINETLEEAATNGHLPIVKHLLSSITDLKTQQNALVIALTAATKSGKLDVVDYLCNLSSSSTVQNAVFSLLQSAIKSKKSQTVALFCNLTTNKLQPKFSVKLLQEAIKGGELDIVKTICQTFTPLSQRNLDFAIPLAVEWCHPVIVTYLCELPENKPTPKMLRLALNKAISTKQGDIIHYLRSKLIEVRHQVDSDDLTPKAGQTLGHLGLFGHKSGKTLYFQETSHTASVLA